MNTSGIIMALIFWFFAGISCAEAESGNPFGFETQTHPLNYEYCKKREPKDADNHFTYECSSAPRMHPDIESILLYFIEGAGLCFIEARSFKRGQDETKELVDTFQEQITQKYGSPSSKSDVPDYKDPYRSIYRYDWDKKAGFGGLGDVDGIGVRAGDGFSRARVFFGLGAACKEKIDERRGMAF